MCSHIILWQKLASVVLLLALCIVFLLVSNAISQLFPLHFPKSCSTSIAIFITDSVSCWLIKGGKFLNKLWWGVLQDNLVLSTELIM